MTRRELIAAALFLPAGTKLVHASTKNVALDAEAEFNQHEAAWNRWVATRPVFRIDDSGPLIERNWEVTETETGRRFSLMVLSGVRRPAFGDVIELDLALRDSPTKARIQMRGLIDYVEHSHSFGGQALPSRGMVARVAGSVFSFESPMLIENWREGRFR